jgi:hypothetical protein
MVLAIETLLKICTLFVVCVVTLLSDHNIHCRKPQRLENNEFCEDADRNGRGVNCYSGVSGDRTHVNHGNCQPGQMSDLPLDPLWSVALKTKHEDCLSKCCYSKSKSRNQLEFLATRYGMDGRGIESQRRRDIPPPVHAGPGVRPAHMSLKLMS